MSWYRFSNRRFRSLVGTRCQMARLCEPEVIGAVSNRALIHTTKPSIYLSDRSPNIARRSHQWSRGATRRMAEMRRVEKPPFRRRLRPPVSHGRPPLGIGGKDLQLVGGLDGAAVARDGCSPRRREPEPEPPQWPVGAERGSVAIQRHCTQRAVRNPHEPGETPQRPA